MTTYRSAECLVSSRGGMLTGGLVGGGSLGWDEGVDEVGKLLFWWQLADSKGCSIEKKAARTVICPCREASDATCSRVFGSYPRKPSRDMLFGRNLR